MIGIRKSATWYNEHEKKWYVNSKRKHEIIDKYPGDPFVLMECPLTDLCIETDKPHGIKNVPLAVEWMNDTFKTAVKHGFTPAFYDHRGASPYIRLRFSRPLSKTEKLLIARYIMPKEAFEFLDKSNLTDHSLVPLIEAPHWKHGFIHKLLKGTRLDLQRNIMPDDWKQQAEEKEKPKIEHHLTIDKQAEVEQILVNDYQVQKLISGKLPIHFTASEGRMKLLVILSAYGLDDQEIHAIMDRSIALNWQGKNINLQFSEISKARAFVTKPRTLVKRGVA